MHVYVYKNDKGTTQRYAERTTIGTSEKSEKRTIVICNNMNKSLVSKRHQTQRNKYAFIHKV